MSTPDEGTWQRMQAHRVPLLPQTEAEWQRFVTDYAESLGWDWMHVGRVGKYQANGAKGTLGKGWPDLTMVRGKQLIWVECKVEDEELSDNQRKVKSRIERAADYYIWRPSDFALMAEVLHS